MCVAFNNKLFISQLYNNKTTTYMVITKLTVSSTFYTSEGSKYPYRVVLSEMVLPNTKQATKIISLERAINANGKYGPIPSGWYLDDVNYNTSVCIDSHSNWYVNIPKDIWDEINS